MFVAQTLADVFNHIAFPPKLPGKKDREPEKVERDLIIRLRYAVQTLCNVADDALKPVWESIIATLDTCSAVNQNGMVNKVALLDALGKVHPGGAVIVNIGEQNAALLIRMPQSGDHVIIEAFETSPTAEKTLAASGALQWTFPATAVSLPVEEFKDPVLQASLADFLEKVSIEKLEHSAAKARKAGKEVVESRDTVDPAIITDFLITLLGANGSHISPPALQKRVKDDVCWDNSELPWRRSPFWLVLRVSLQRLLYLYLDHDLGRLQYKFLLCTVLAHLLGDLISNGVLEPEQWSWLNTKLCRRLAKLETERQTSSTAVNTVHAHLSQKLGPAYENNVTAARNAMSNKWEAFKRGTKRKIPHLPLYSQPKDLLLSLPNSISYLQKVLSLPQSLAQRTRNVKPVDLSTQSNKGTGDQFASLVRRYTSIAELELKIELGKKKTPTSKDEIEDLCLKIARWIKGYLDLVGQSDNRDQEQMSFVILTVLELWIYMDKCAIATYPVLSEYHPVFFPELLDVLLLSTLADLKRLQEVQTYLHNRCTAAVRKEMTIFTDPVPGCFADRFLELSIGKDLVKLQGKIEAASSVAQDKKMSELISVNQEFKSLTEAKDSSVCTQRMNPDGTHDIRGCSHCYYIRRRRRLQIAVHEDYLPTDHKLYEKRAIVFELGLPPVFAAYRSATWTIINRLGPSKDSDNADQPHKLLREHAPLASYLKNKSNGGISLASYTKSHLGTHYKWKSLPASTSSILRPFGLTFLYYDTDRQVWVKSKHEPLTFAHNFLLRLPPNLPFSSLYSSSNFAPDGPGPSSYESIAKMRHCPSTVTVHEFLAHQTLMSGKHRRWLSILTELGSSNINLSSLDAMVLLRHLALQVGPNLEDDTLRVVHTVFRDIRFCRRLIEQIDQHATTIAPNWREVTYMETLLTLSIQVYNLGCQDSKAGAEDLLLKIRRITLNWISHLRLETRNALEVDIAERAARYCVLAALLCRRTFFPEAHAGGTLDSESFQCFIEATLAMQESMVIDLSKFDDLTHSMLVRDLKMAVRLRSSVQAAVKAHPESIASAIDNVWPISVTGGHVSWQNLPKPYDLWVAAESGATEHTLPQTIHIHLLEGHFLVDGKPLGKLPADIRDSGILKELFGNQRLTAFPSNRPGMSYTLAIDKEGCQIHLGYRSQDLVIQTTTRDGRTLELIPRSVFSKGQTLDLPLSLVHHCVHWLDLRTGILEARRMPAIWITRPGNWKLDIRTRKAQRHNKSYLVDPHSQLAATIASMFLHFEQPSMLTIYQPPVRGLSVELKRMNLNFHVNKRGLLQSQQLGVEIDPDQDAGTFSIQEILSADLALEWGSLVRLCRDCGPQDAYKLMFHLGLISYGDGVSMDMVRVLAAFSIFPELKDLELPPYPSFEGFQDDGPPDVATVMALVKPFCKEYHSPAGQENRSRKKNKAWYKETGAERVKHETQCLTECESFALSLIKGWPCSEPSATWFSGSVLDVEGAIQEICPDWLRRYKNLQLSGFVEDVQRVLDASSASVNGFRNPPTNLKPKIVWARSARASKITLQLDQDLMCHPGPKVVPSASVQIPLNQMASAHQLSSSNITALPSSKRTRESQITELEQIVRGITNSECSVRSTYGQDLQLSIDALRKKDERPMDPLAADDSYSVGMAKYDNEIRNARTAVRRIYDLIYEKLSARDTRGLWLQHGNIWPCITPRTILQQLRTTTPIAFEPRMKQALISYGLAIVNLQRLVRMQELFAKHDLSRLEQEQRSPSHASWDYMEYPDWILLEIDANMQIRQEQVTVAQQMVAPTSGSNSVLQMNMGQGKTSVIMPMVACALANCDNLVRLLVPKALTTQTAQVLQGRLGGLVGRELVHIPFSRRTPTTMELIGEYRSLHEEVSTRAGIILGVPEHALSFKLSGLQKVSDLKLTEAAEMIMIQEWIDTVGRDILDECDYTLAVKTQLIYPSGSQLAVDGHPDRWEATMDVLGLVAQHVRDLASAFPHSIDVVERPLSSFPLVFILRQDVAVALSERLVKDICSGRGSVLPVHSWGVAEQEMIKQFISQETLDPSILKSIERLFQDVPRACKRAYLLRGLIVHRILLLCLKKRWNVQYGLHPGRDPVAVPFQAKGVPSEYAEWGHPDVAILFTCLAFYYGGLSQEQCRRCLQAVLKSDDPATEYDRWTQTSTDIPEALRHWNLLNVDDHGQVAEFWQHMRFSMVVINYFLKHFVFPVHAKQFAIKLQTSGWDVPFNNSTKVAHRNSAGLTTGFSGTNDNRRLLPLTIEQHDLPELLHTNAEVLTYLLQDRNREYRHASSDGRRISEADLLTNLANSEIRVLIDAGAFILEMDNLTLVKTWLEKSSEAQAAVYFAPDNKPWVWYRIGKKLPLLATPYADNLKDCLVYLDEAHTRGTDLKLPADAKGALTLGLNQTKDHTVQAAMRLRQLGTTQSIVFIAPPEVHQSILDVNQKSHDEKLDSADVINWLLHQTCASNAELEPLFHSQGVDFCCRMQAASQFPNFLNNKKDRKDYMAVLQQPEQQTLEELYQPRLIDCNGEGTSRIKILPAAGKVAKFLEELQHRRNQSDLLQSAITSSALEEVEQEREVAYEIEEERELQRPQKLKGYHFPGLHPALAQFAQTGRLQGSGALSAASVLQGTHLALKYGIKDTNQLAHLLVSVEFTRTVKSKHNTGDEFTRPVNWLLCNTKNETAIVIIPEEVEELIPILRTCAAPSTYLITYAAPVTRRMLHFERLDYYTIPTLCPSDALPSWLSFEVGILAGRLYFGYKEYEGMMEQMQLGPEWVDANSPASRKLTNYMSFLQEWLALRRQGQDISHTPMGYVCQRRPLRADHPFFADMNTKKGGDHILRSSGYATGTKEEQYYDSDEDDVGDYAVVEDESFEDAHEEHGKAVEQEDDKVDEEDIENIENIEESK
ncbi:hypothetical protein CBS147353_187 [Aspergillus niger]|nr:hypothetical protein CBS147353_187 [Aspergillus niger]